jgi:hypothetical protein
MNIIRHEYDSVNRILYVEFSINEDEDIFYRVMELTYEDVILYSPNIIADSEIEHLENYDVIEILTEYFKDNQLPGQIYL